MGYPIGDLTANFKNDENSSKYPDSFFSHQFKRKGGKKFFHPHCICKYNEIHPFCSKNMNLT